MNGIVVDASVTLSWCFPDEQTPMALQVLDRLKAGEQAIVPSFWSGNGKGALQRNRQKPSSMHCAP